MILRHTSELLWSLLFCLRFLDGFECSGFNNNTLLKKKEIVSNYTKFILVYEKLLIDKLWDMYINTRSQKQK